MCRASYPSLVVPAVAVHGVVDGRLQKETRKALRSSSLAAFGEPACTSKTSCWQLRAQASSQRSNVRSRPNRSTEPQVRIFGWLIYRGGPGVLASCRGRLRKLKRLEKVHVVLGSALMPPCMLHCVRGLLSSDVRRSVLILCDRIATSAKMPASIVRPCILVLLFFYPPCQLPHEVQLTSSGFLAPLVDGLVNQVVGVGDIFLGFATSKHMYFRSHNGTIPCMQGHGGSTRSHAAHSRGASCQICQGQLREWQVHQPPHPDRATAP